MEQAKVGLKLVGAMRPKAGIGHVLSSSQTNRWLLFDDSSIHVLFEPTAIPNSVDRALIKRGRWV